MKSVLIDGEWLAVALPEGFEVIEHQELETLMDLKYKYMWGVRDTERHMLMRVTWKDSNKLITKLVSERSFAKQIDKKYARCRPGSGYRSEGLFERSVTGADAPAQGFRFSYTVEGVGQCGEVLVFKRGIRCYTLVYSRAQRLPSKTNPPTRTSSPPSSCARAAFVREFGRAARRCLSWLFWGRTVVFRMT